MSTYVNGIEIGGNGSGSSSSSTSSSSSSIGGGNSIYSNVQGDFTATANSGAKTITFSAYASTILSANVNSLNFTNVLIKRRTTAGIVDTLPTTTVSFSANVLTLSDMTANFAAGDTVSVFVPGYDKAFDRTDNMTYVYLGTDIAGEDRNNNIVYTTNKYTSYPISTAGTFVAKTGPGIVANMVVQGGVAGTITIYDALTATGTPIYSFDSTSAINSYPLGSSFNIGLTIVTSTAIKLTFNII